MFVKNHSALPRDNVVWINCDVKNYLISLGYCPLSFNDNKWAFAISDDLLNSIKKHEKGGKHG